MATLLLDNVSKQFPGVTAVREVRLEIRSGEFFSILGPSGCGKTTLLRIIAGFETPTGGRILIGDRDVTHVSPRSRGIGMVFQNYALFPHMTVEQNIAFGLETQRVSAAEIRRRVDEALTLVHLQEKRAVPVPLLSGGEQQRVAVARALVVRPAVLLMDEPLSNLDLALRLKTREEIRMLQRATGITTVFVTHDQSEAMSLSDRIAVMRSGAIEQVGAPAEIYERPGSEFVAQFLGGANILRGEYDPTAHVLRAGSWMIPVPEGHVPRDLTRVAVAVKPEAFSLVERDHEPGNLATVREVAYLGFLTHLVLGRDGDILRVATVSSEVTKRLVVGATVGLRIDWHRCTVFPDR